MSVTFRADVPPSVMIQNDKEARELLYLSLNKVERDPGSYIGWDTETTGKKVVMASGKKSAPLDWMSDFITFWSISFDTDKPNRWCIPAEYFMYFAPLLENPKATFACWNAKYDAHIAWNCGVNVWNANIHDGLAMSHLHDENRFEHGLKSCAADWCGLEMTPYKSLFADCRDKDGKKVKEFATDLRDLPLDLVADYASYDAYAHLRSVEWLREKMEATPINKHGDNLFQYFLDMEVFMTEVLWRMERRGLDVDLETLQSKIPIIDKRIQELLCDINRAAGKPINLGSTKQLAEFFFLDKDGLNLPTVKLTGTGKPSTDKDVMESLAESGVEMASFILECRSLEKVKSTYLTTLIDLAMHYDDGRLHPNFNQFGARCMPDSELVLTNRGYLPVSMVSAGDQVISHRGKSQEVAEVFANGVRPVLKVTLDNGLELRTTKNHRYRTDKSWTRAENLKPGDTVSVHSGKEEWASVTDWEDFSVSSWGRIYNNKTERMVTQYPKGKWGHLKVMLRRDGCQDRGENLRDLTVHRLVARAFLGTPEEGMEVRHLNGIAWDNTVWNLKWGTVLENRADAKLHGTMQGNGEIKVGEEEEIALIRSTEKTWGSDTRLSEKLGISREHVRDIRIGKRRSDLRPEEERGGRAEFGVSPVVSVVEEPPVQTYGLSVSNDHSHVTGGIVTHNTGRFSTSNPNSQNQPRPGNDEWGIRENFVAPEGGKLIVGDYEQLEMRIMADRSGDQKMIQAIGEGKDLHSATVAYMSPDIAYESVVAAKKAEEPTDYQKTLKVMRQDFKAVGFGIIYGAGPPAISKRITITDEEIGHRLSMMGSKEINRRVASKMKKNPILTKDGAEVMVARESIAADKIQSYFNIFPGVKRYMDKIPEECRYTMSYDFWGNERNWDLEERIPGAKRTTVTGHTKRFGMVQTLVGRYRRLEDIDHRTYMLRAEAERQAVNTTVQGSAADITKGAMCRVETNSKLIDLGVEMINQVHDEIICRVPEAHAEVALPIIIECMEHPFEEGKDCLSVPLPVDIKIVDRWSEAK